MDEEVKNEGNKDNKALTVGLVVLGLIIVLVVVVLVVSKFLGQGSMTKPVAPTVGQPTATESSLTGPETSGILKEVPAEFPKDFPVITGAQVKEASVTDTGPNVIWTTNESLTTVVDFYKKSLDSAGWKINSSQTVELGTVMNIEKDNLKGTVAISRAQDSNQTLIFVGIQK